MSEPVLILWLLATVCTVLATGACWEVARHGY